MITPGSEMEHDIDRIAVLATGQGADIVGGRPHDGSFVREIPDGDALGSKSQDKT